MSQELVGRELELATLAGFIDGAGSGSQAMLLQGEAGIGKTVLWQAGLALAAERHGLRVLACRPAESEAGLSFSTLGDLLGPVVEQVVDELPDPQRRALEVALLLREGEASDVDHRTVSAAVLGTIRAVARTGPLLVGIDDVQWIDRPSARVLEYALRRLEDVGVSVLVAERTSGETGAVPLGLDRALGERLERLRIGPLSVGAIHHLLRERLGTSFARPTLVRLHEACGGNPFFALEIARALLEREEPLHAGESLPLPPSLHELVAGRLRRLPHSTRYVLLLAALASHPTVDAVTRALGDPDRALTDLSEAEESGVIEVTGGRVRFTHPLLASTLLEGASLRDQRRAHRSLFEASEDPESRARHLALSTDGPDEEVAAVLEDAARDARARGATEAAAELGELAVERTPVGDIGGRVRRSVASADDLVDAVDGVRARRVLDEASYVARPGPERAAILWRRAILSEEPAEAKGLLSQALVEAEDDHVSISSSHSYLSILDFVGGDLPSAIRHAEDALTAADRTDDTDLQARAITHLLTALGLSGKRIPASVWGRALVLDGRVDRAPVWESPGLWIGILSMCRSDLDTARSFMEAAFERARRIGDDYSRGEVLLHMTELECRAGNFVKASLHANEGSDLAQQNGLEQDAGAMLFGVALAEAYLGNVDAARMAGTQGLDVAMRFEDRAFEIQHRWALGFLALSLGDNAEAVQWLSTVPGLTKATDILEPGICLYAPNLIESLIALGELERATELLEEFESRARELEHPWATATGWRCRALLCAARGDQEGATAAIEQGLIAHEAIPEPFELGRMHLVTGTIWRRFKQKRRARESLEQALETFESLQTPLWADKARAELSRIGLRAAEPGGLTPTEQRIAELVVAGRTNQEIADELFVSIRTVEANLTRSYRKLEVRSRTELVARMRETPA